MVVNSCARGGGHHGHSVCHVFMWFANICKLLCPWGLACHTHVVLLLASLRSSYQVFVAKRNWRDCAQLVSQLVSRKLSGCAVANLSLRLSGQPIPEFAV